MPSLVFLKRWLGTSTDAGIKRSTEKQALLWWCRRSKMMMEVVWLVSLDMMCNSVLPHVSNTISGRFSGTARYISAAGNLCRQYN